MKRIYWLSILIVSVLACQDDQVLKEDNGLNTDSKVRMSAEGLTCGDAVSYPLMVSTTQVGTATVTVTEAGFNVHYDLTSSQWFLLDIKAFAGDCAEIPNLGVFPFELLFSQDDEVRDFNFDIPWEALPDCGCFYAIATVGRYNAQSQLVTSPVSIRGDYCKCGPPPPPGTVACQEILNIPIDTDGNAAVEVTEDALNISYDVSASEWFFLELKIEAGDCAAPTEVIERLYAQDDEVRVDNVSIPAESLPLCGCFRSTLTLGRFNEVSQLETKVINIDADYCLCEEEEPGGDLRTQTQGGWGAVPNGGNPGTYLHANFDGAFPNDLVVGCATYTLTFTTAQAVTNFLPQGGPARALNASFVNPPNIKNVLAGQVVALKLNTSFDAYDEDFSPSEADLGTAVVQSGPFAGWTVYAVLAEAEKALGGCGSTYTFSQLNEAATAINESWDNGVMVTDYIAFP